MAPRVTVLYSALFALSNMGHACAVSSTPVPVLWTFFNMQFRVDARYRNSYTITISHANSGRDLRVAHYSLVICAKHTSPKVAVATNPLQQQQYGCIRYTK